MSAPNVASLDGRAHAKRHGSTDRGAVPRRWGVCEFGKAGSDPPNSTAAGSTVLRGAYGPPSGGFSLTKHILPSHHLSHSWQFYR